MRILPHAAVLLLIVLPIWANAQNPTIQQIVDAVNVDSLTWRLERLSGMQPVDVGNGAQTILSRNKFQPGNALAAQWLQQEFTRMGYAPEVQVFGAQGGNVLAVKTGLVHPERKVVICGHYDSMPGGTTAPGADDDGSGVGAVMEAARVMAGHDFENTVVFALWDEEEQGLIGSAYYTSAAAGNDEEILAAVQMDAIGYDGNGDGLMRIHTRPVANSIAIKDSVLMVNTIYGLGLPIVVNNPGATYSDHASFWSEGYGAILVIEDFDNDPNPHYHTSSDRMEYMDLAYWQGLTKLTIGTASAMAVPVSATQVSSAVLANAAEIELFPNPVRELLHIRFDTSSATTTILSIIDATGRDVGRPRSMENGSRTVDVSGLVPGAYIACLRSGRIVVSKRFLRLP